MNKKYFVVSDIHSFYYELKDALDEAGYDKKNKNHILVILGDLFDRGLDSKKLFNFIKSIPKSRRILIRGNHEDLFLELLDKEYPDDYDFDNKTVRTFCQLISDKDHDYCEYDLDPPDSYAALQNIRTSTEWSVDLWKEILEKVKAHPVVAFLKSNEWKNYFELDKYIFTHSFIPTYVKDYSRYSKFTREHLHTFQAAYEDLATIDNWRTEASESAWYDARWGCPWELFRHGLFNDEIKKNKVLVCGHWHTSAFRKELNFIHNHSTEIYKNDNLIAIDGGVRINIFSDDITNSLIHDQNVLVIDENLNLFDRYGNKLENDPVNPKIETITIEG